MASKITPKNKPPLNFHHEQVLAEGADLLKQNSRHLKNRTGAFAQMDDATYSKVKDLFLGSEQAQGIGKILSHQEQAQLQIILRGIPEEKIPEFMGLLAQHLDNPMAMRSFLTEFSSFADDLIIDGAIEYQKLTQKIIQHQQGLIPGTQITVTEAFAEVAPARASPKIQGATGKEYAEVFEMDPKYLHEANPDIPFDPNAALFGLERAGRPFKGVVKRISDPKELLKYEVFVDKSGRLVDSNGIAISTRNKMTGDKKAIFVMDSKGRIFVSDQQQIGLFHHSTLSNGEKVATAGEIVIEDGKIISVNSRSGHYQPSDKSLKQLVVELEERKADIASIEIRNYSDRIISPEKIGLRRVPAQSTPVNFNPKELTSAEHHVVFGNLADGHSGKVLHGGMHTQQGLEELLKANSELRVLMQNKPHLIETLENGVKKVMLPRSAFNKKQWNSLKFSSSNGGKAHCRVIDGTEYCQKTLFPADFDLDKIRQSIEHLQQSAFSRKTALNNGLTSIEGVHGDLRLRMILDENNNLITIHPSY